MLYMRSTQPTVLEINVSLRDLVLPEASVWIRSVIEMHLSAT